MKHCSKVTALVLTCMLLISILAACQTSTDNQATTSPTTAATEKATKAAATEEPMTLDNITFVARSGYQVEWEGSNLDLLIQEKFGLKMDLQIIDNSAYGEKFKVMFSTNNLPDLSNAVGITTDEINEAGQKGVFLDFYDYMDIMPALRQILTENQGLLPFITAGDGSLYSAPLYFGMGEVMGGTMLAARKDMLDAAGFDYENLEDLDDVYALLTALKEQNPDNYVFSSQYGLGNLFNMGQMMGVAQAPGTWDATNDVWMATYRQETLKDFVNFWADAYADGILHPDFLTMARTDYWQMYYNGELSAFCDAGTGMDDCIKNTDIEGMEYTHIIMPLHNGTRYGIASSAGMILFMGKLVNANTAAPEKIMKFIDWLYTDEGFGRVYLGEEGVDYVVMSEDPFEWINLDATYADSLPEEYQDKLLTAEVMTARKVTLPYQIYGMYARNYLAGHFQKQNYYTTTSLYQVAYPACEAAGLFSEAEPTITLPTEDLDEFNELKTTIKDYTDEIIAQMITGQIDIEGYWDTFQQTLDDYDYDRLMELYATSAQNFFSVEPNFNP